MFFFFVFGDMYNIHSSPSTIQNKRSIFSGYINSYKEIGRVSSLSYVTLNKRSKKKIEREEKASDITIAFYNLCRFARVDIKLYTTYMFISYF